MFHYSQTDTSTNGDSEPALVAEVPAEDKEDTDKDESSSSSSMPPPKEPSPGSKRLVGRPVTFSRCFSRVFLGSITIQYFNRLKPQFLCGSPSDGTCICMFPNQLL